MPLLTKSKLINNTLTFKYRHCRRVVFWLKSTGMVPVVQSVLFALDQHNQSVLPDNIEILKNTPVNKRLLFRIKMPTEESFVVKVLTLHLFRLRLKYWYMKHHRYRFAEAANLIIANKRGLRVPQVHGYGRIHGPSGLIKKDMVILEDLNNHISFNELLEQNKANKQECINILNRLIPVFVSHYKAMCNNWDINTSSVIFDRDNPEHPPYVLDFEHIVFLKKPSLENLMFLAAKFAAGFPGWMSKEVVYSWAAEILNPLNIEDVNEKKNLVKRFGYYLNLPYMPHRQRMRIR